jgi:hypothetical protein
VKLLEMDDDRQQALLGCLAIIGGLILGAVGSALIGYVIGLSQGGWVPVLLAIKALPIGMVVGGVTGVAIALNWKPFP